MALDSQTIEYVIKVRDEATKGLKNIAVAAVAATAALVAIGGAVKGAMDFDTAMREVATLTPQMKKELEFFKGEVLDLSSAMGIDAVEASNALYQAISAGVPSDNAMEFMQVASMAAIGGVTDLETAVDGISTVINAYGKEASDASNVSDVMFEAVKAGKTNFEQLSASLFNVVPMAAAVGVSFEEVASSIAVMTAQGIPTSVATTQMRAAMQGLLRPTAELTELAEKMGFENMQAAIEADGLTSALVGILEATDGDVGAMQTLLGSVEAVQAALVLGKDGGEAMSAQMDIMANSAGATAEAYETMAEGLGQQWKVMQTSLKNLGIEIGSVLLPILLPVVETIAKMVAKFAEFTRAHPALIKGILIAVAVFAAMILALTAGIAIVAALGAVFILIGGSIPIIIAAILAVVIGLVVAMHGKWMGFIKFFKTLWENIKEIATFNTDVIGILFKGMFDNLMKAADIWLDNIKAAFSAVFGWIGETITAVARKIAQIVSDTIKLISGKSKQITIYTKYSGTAGAMPTFEDVEAARRLRGGLVKENITLVGEQGPELVNLPRGSFVHTAQQSKGMMGGNEVNITIQVDGSLIGASKEQLASMVGDLVMRKLGAYIPVR